MPRKPNLQQIESQIAELQGKAEALRMQERAGVIDRIRAAIEHYDITSAELYGKAKPAKRAGTGKIKYRDDAGNTWTGFGPKPRWFLAALEAGKTVEDLQA